jgi:hypothetical protein
MRSVQYEPRCASLHDVSEPPHVTVPPHTPLLQPWPAGQMRPQPPQFCGSFVVSVQ